MATTKSNGAVRKATRKAAKATAAKKGRRTLMDDLLDDQDRKVRKAEKTKKLSKKIAKATGTATTDGSVVAATASDEIPQPDPARVEAIRAAVSEKLDAAPAAKTKPRFFGRKKGGEKKSSWARLNNKQKDAKREASREHWKSLPDGHWHRVYRKDAGNAWNKIKRGVALGDAKLEAEGRRELAAAKKARDAAKKAEANGGAVAKPKTAKSKKRATA